MRPPAWIASVDEALAVTTRGIRLLSAATPVNAQAERARLLDAALRSDPLVPRWSYAPPPIAALDDARAALDAIARRLESLGPDPLAKIYEGRAHEAALEAQLITRVGQPDFAELAIRRFFPPSIAIETAARALCATWKSADADAETETFATDSGDERSLLSCMQREIGKRRLPFRVVVHPALSSLAATGDGVVLVTSGRRISHAAAERTVLHEIEGHALPRVRASRQELAIFRIGTAGGVDEQEGLALTIEERHGFLHGDRLRDLAARSRAVEAMRDGACFSDVVRVLQIDHARAASDAIAIAERIFRGSNGITPGLGRESVYVPSFVRMRETFARSPEAEAVIDSGQVAIDAWRALEPYVAA